MQGGTPGERPAGTADLPQMTDRRRWLLRGLIVAVAVAAGLVTWLATRSGSTPPAPESSSRVVSQAELAEAAVLLNQPIYWAGPIPGKELVLEEVAEGARVLYQPEGTDPEEGSPAVLTIGSYPLADPAAAVKDIGGGRGAIVRRRAGHEVAASAREPTSVYFASPENSVQVEVYDPSPRRAMSLALSERVEPVR